MAVKLKHATLTFPFSTFSVSYYCLHIKISKNYKNYLHNRLKVRIAENMAAKRKGTF